MTRGKCICGCGRSFGLIQHKILTFNGYLSFATEKCKREYTREVMARVKKRQNFFRWLHGESPQS